MGACITPFVVQMKKEGRNIPVPCGKCPECLARRVSAWSFRLMQEDKRAKSAFFLTLTFSTKKVPITLSGFMSLDKTVLQKFFKRLRKLNPVGIKYYAVGEYGEKTMRPHYHVILFNAELATIQPAWNLGEIHYGEVNGASIGYTLKYMSKVPKIPMHRNDDRLREFSLMSKGLGSNYLTDAMVKWHEADIYERMYCNVQDGKKIAMPRYYKDKIYTMEQREHIAANMVTKMFEAEQQKEIELYQLHGENLEKVKVEIHQQKFKKMYSNASKNRDKL